MKKEIFIIGSGGFAKEVAFLIEDINKSHKDEWIIRGFVNSQEKLGTQNGKYSVVTTDDEISNSQENIFVALGIGEPNLSKKIITKFKSNKNISFPNLLHPNFIGDIDGFKMGEGNIITSGNIFTTDIIIGSFNIFNLGCTLGHDAVIGDFNIFNPSVNLSGGVKISNQNLIGTGAQILQNITFECDRVIIGAGAVLSKNINEPGVYIGIPAKKRDEK